MARWLPHLSHVWALTADGEALSTFGTTGIDHASTSFGRHSSSKTVSTITLNVAGLKSTLHAGSVVQIGCGILGALGLGVNWL